MAVIHTFEAFDSDWFVLFAYRKCPAVNNGKATSHQRLLLLNLRRLHFLPATVVNERCRVFFAFNFPLKFTHKS